MVLLIAGSLIARELLPSAEEVAREECVVWSWPAADRLLYSGFKQTRGWLGLGQEHVADFIVKDSNPLKQVRVTLRRSISFLPWRVEKIEERARADD